jgi:hypothetical protein
MVDKDLIAAWWRLGELRKRLLAEHGMTLPAPPANATRDQVRSYLERSKRLVAANASEPLPQLVRRRYPRLSPLQWASLSDEARDLVVGWSATAANGRGSTTGGCRWGFSAPVGDVLGSAVSGLVDAAADLEGFNGSGSDERGFPRFTTIGTQSTNSMVTSPSNSLESPEVHAWKRSTRRY